MSDVVNHPPHYKFPNGAEVIDITENLGFLAGNVVKYVARAGRKSDDQLQDLQKARWYLDRLINNEVKEAAPEQLQAAADGVLSWMRSIKADAWEKGALWAAAECGVIKPDCPPEQWLTPGDNPYEQEPLDGTTS